LKLGKWRTRDEVRCLTKASSSLKTPAIPPFYKIITDNQSTKLVYSSSKVRGSSPKHICPRTSAAGSIAGGGLGVTGAVSLSDLDISYGVGADTPSYAVAPSTLVVGLAEAVGVKSNKAY